MEKKKKVKFNLPGENREEEDNEEGIDEAPGKVNDNINDDGKSKISQLTSKTKINQSFPQQSMNQINPQTGQPLIPSQQDIQAQNLQNQTNVNDYNYQSLLANYPGLLQSKNGIEAKDQEETLVCWNCLSVLKIKPEWGIIQCPHCDKMNRVPKNNDLIQKQDEKVLVDNDRNHFDIAAPYVYAIMVCPYCKAENKVRKEAEHIICYKCANSFSIANPTIKCISSKNPITLTSKVTRISDYFFPDPKHLPGPYPYPYQQPVMPQPIVLEKPCCMNNRAELEQQKTEIMNTLIDKKTKKPKREYVYDRLAPIRNLLNDVDDIEKQRVLKYGQIGRNYSALGKSGNNIMNRGYNIQNNIPNNNYNNLGNSVRYNGSLTPIQPNNVNRSLINQSPIGVSNNFYMNKNLNDFRTINDLGTFDKYYKHDALYKIMFNK